MQVSRLPSANRGDHLVTIQLLVAIAAAENGIANRRFVKGDSHKIVCPSCCDVALEIMARRAGIEFNISAYESLVIKISEIILKFYPSVGLFFSIATNPVNPYWLMDMQN